MNKKKKNSEEDTKQTSGDSSWHFNAQDHLLFNIHTFFFGIAEVY